MSDNQSFPLLSDFDLESFIGVRRSTPKGPAGAAAEQERFENDMAQLGRNQTQERPGEHAAAIRSAAVQIARSVKTEQELIRAIKNNLTGSWLVRNTGDAQTLIDVAIGTYPFADRDWAHLLALDLLATYERNRITQRQGRVEEIRRAIEADPVRTFAASAGIDPNLVTEYIEKIPAGQRLQTIEQQLLLDPILKLSAETGLDPTFVKTFLDEYRDAQMEAQLRPLRIDPRGIPFIQLTLPIYGIAYLIKGMLPGVGVFEAITGKDLLSGEDLSTTERVLGAVLDILPYVPGAFRLAGRGAAAALRGLRRAAAGWAITALRLRLPPTPTLRFLGRMSNVPPEEVRQFLVRVRAARAAGETLDLAVDERRLAQELELALKEFDGPPVRAVTHAAPREIRYIFKNGTQSRVLQQLLTRELSLASRPGVRTAIQSAEEAATGLRSKIEAHWRAAVTGRGESQAAAARRVFRELKKAAPKSAALRNDLVRHQLYDLWRRRALRRIYNDAGLRRELLEEAGVVVERSGRDNYSMFLRAAAPEASVAKVPIDFDHFRIGHAQAVERAWQSGDFRHLISTVSSDNLQLITGPENRNFIETIRRLDRQFHGE